MELCEEINAIVENGFLEDQLTNSSNEGEGDFHSLQADWRAEIKVIFEQLKNIEQVSREKFSSFRFVSNGFLSPSAGNARSRTVALETQPRIE